MSVTITINGQTAGETLQELWDLAGGTAAVRMRDEPTPVDPATPGAQQAATPRTRRTRTVEQPKTDPMAEQPKPADEPKVIDAPKAEEPEAPKAEEAKPADDLPASDEFPAKQEEPVTRESLRPLILAGAAIDGIGPLKVRETLMGFGAAKVPDIDAKHYPELKCKLEQLIVAAGLTVEAALLKGAEVEANAAKVKK